MQEQADPRDLRDSRWRGCVSVGGVDPQPENSNLLLEVITYYVEILTYKNSKTIIRKSEG